MKKFSLLLLLFFYAAAVLMSQNVFIETYPINATVYFDGKLLEDQTPLKLTNVEPGIHTVKIVKKDYKLIEAEISVSADQPTIFLKKLTHDFIIHRFPGEDKIIFNKTIVENQDQLFRLDEGKFLIKRKEGLINIIPQYEHQWAINGLAVGLPLFALGSAGLIIDDYFSNEGEFRLSAVSIISLGGTAASAGILAGLLINKAKFIKSIPFTIEEAPSNDEVAFEYYSIAEGFLSNGAFQEAQLWYLKVIENHPESRYYPESLYKIAKIHYLSGNDKLAFSELKLLERKYPSSALYDRICKTAADVLYRMGDYKTAMEYLEKMEFIDTLYDQKEIKDYMETIREYIK